MKQEEVDDILKTMISERLEAAAKSMSSFKVLERAWKDMMLSGFVKQAKVFKNTIYTYLLAHPDATEKEIITMLANLVGYNLENNDRNRKNDKNPLLAS